MIMAESLGAFDLMHSIDAISTAPATSEWLANSRQPRILHVFQRTCNLINERREILSVVACGIGNGPFNLVVDESSGFTKQLTSESRVTIEPGCLNIGELRINLETAKHWPARPDWETLHANSNRILSQLAALVSDDNRAALPKDLTSNFCTFVVRAKLPAALAAASKLAGRGAGLTPAGDDFMLGALLAGWILHPSDVAGRFANETAQAAAALTSSLSAAWLRSVGRGEAGILWHALFLALLSGTSIQIQRSIRAILSVGESSGADALSGFTGCVTAFANAAGRNVH